MKNEIVGSITNILESIFSSIILLLKFLAIVFTLFILMIFNNFFSSSSVDSMKNTNRLKKFVRDNVGTTDDYE